MMSVLDRLGMRGQRDAVLPGTMNDKLEMLLKVSNGGDVRVEYSKMLRKGWYAHIQINGPHAEMTLNSGYYQSPEQAVDELVETINRMQGSGL